MQDFPRYLVHSEAPGELGWDIELRLERGSAGGLPGLPEPDDVARAVAAALEGAGSTRVTAALVRVESTPVPAAAPAPEQEA
ncbi:hypothetical protein ACFVHR_04900 [Streptomyces sp. NPDC127168]|uniref:hypothetical protein n=1 Tax=unclassified Streptomyces TaxID=2593676 RepID=UPI003633903E